MEVEAEMAPCTSGITYLMPTLLPNLKSLLQKTSIYLILIYSTPTYVDVKVNLVQPNHTVDMISNLWKRAKPINQEDIAGTSPYHHYPPSSPSHLLTFSSLKSPTVPTLTSPHYLFYTSQRFLSRCYPLIEIPMHPHGS